MRDLRNQIGTLADGHDRLSTELDAAKGTSAERDQFQLDHVGDASLLAAVERHVDDAVAQRVEDIASDPSDEHLRILGAVPIDPKRRARWLRAATAIERHRLGLEEQPAWADRASLVGTPTERAEAIARVQLIADTNSSGDSRQLRAELEVD